MKSNEQRELEMVLEIHAGRNGRSTLFYGDAGILLLPYGRRNLLDNQRGVVKWI